MDAIVSIEFEEGTGVLFEQDNTVLRELGLSSSESLLTAGQGGKLLITTGTAQCVSTNLTDKPSNLSSPVGSEHTRAKQLDSQLGDSIHPRETGLVTVWLNEHWDLHHR